MNPAIKPVTILTGFLGAGKTTFLNYHLSQNKDIRYAIIENEFGEQGIDSELVVRPEETIVELNNGCLCCTLNANLYDIVNALFDRRDEFNEIIIEATGVADPAGLAEPFVSHPLIKEFFPLKNVICLVDAELIERHLQETEEAINQLAFSDVLLINKTDLVSPGYLQELEEKLHGLVPLAQVLSGRKDAFPLIDQGTRESPMEEIFRKSKELPSVSGEYGFPVVKPHSHHHHKHTEEIISHTFIFDEPFDSRKLKAQFFIYLQVNSANLYRMKSLIWLDGCEEQFLLQSVGKRLDIEEKRTWEPAERKRSVLVFIGKNLIRKGIEEMLQKCLSKQLSTSS